MNEKLVEQLINKYEIQGYDLHGEWDSQEIDKIKAFAEDYHQAKCAESVPVAVCVTNPFSKNSVCAIQWIDDNYKPKLGDKLFTVPQPYDADAKLKVGYCSARLPKTIN